MNNSDRPANQQIGFRRLALTWISIGFLAAAISVFFPYDVANVLHRLQSNEESARTLSLLILAIAGLLAFFILYPYYSFWRPLVLSFRHNVGFEADEEGFKH